MSQGGDAGLTVRPSPSVMQHAVRLLALLDGCGDPVVQGDPDGCVAVIRAELRLQALDFWLRNPDYLAGELLTMVEANGLPAEEYLPVIEELPSRVPNRTCTGTRCPGGTTARMRPSTTPSRSFPRTGLRRCAAWAASGRQPAASSS